MGFRSGNVAGHGKISMILHLNQFLALIDLDCPVETYTSCILVLNEIKIPFST